jgi:hypothetical protein
VRALSGQLPLPGTSTGTPIIEDSKKTIKKTASKAKTTGSTVESTEEPTEEEV